MSQRIKKIYSGVKEKVFRLCIPRRKTLKELTPKDIPRGVDPDFCAIDLISRDVWREFQEQQEEQEKVLQELKKGIVRGKKPSFGILEEELAYFNKIKPSLLAKHKGEYVLIKESRVVEILPTGEACYDLGLQLFPNEPMLIKKIQDVEPVYTAPYLLLPKIPKN